jgi:hypothetical protein
MSMLLMVLDPPSHSLPLVVMVVIPPDALGLVPLEVVDVDRVRNRIGTVFAEFTHYFCNFIIQIALLAGYTTDNIYVQNCN